MVGYVGMVYWFFKSEGRFVIFSYYMEFYFGWVSDWNDVGYVVVYVGIEWQLVDSKDMYCFVDFDDVYWEIDFFGFGCMFLYLFGLVDNKYFIILFMFSLVGDEFIVFFVKFLIDNEGIGDDVVMDYLFVSFFLVDYVGYIFGLFSFEVEDNFR